MRALVVYESAYGNTRRIAEMIAEGLAETAEVDVRSVDDLRPVHASDYQLIVVGGPTHAYGMSTPASRAEAHRRRRGDIDHGGIGEWLPWIGFDYPGAIAAFDSRCGRSRRRARSASGAIGRQLRRAGYRLFDRRSFLVEKATGPLRDGELYQARLWGTEMALKLRSGPSWRTNLRLARRA
jgi:hypothetical protein